MTKSKTVSFVSLSEIYDHLQLTDDEVDTIATYGFSNVSFGDADHTLIGNHFALSCITDGMLNYYDELNDTVGEPSRNIPERILSPEEIAQKFWEIVGQNDYVDLEG